ncbi:MAG: universal stress protein [Halovenus sp.]
MYQDILYPTDGSGGATAALEHAGDLAEKYDATVHVLYVLNTSEPGLGLGEDPDKEHAPGMIGHPSGEGAGMIGGRETHDELLERQEEYGEAVVEAVADRLEGVDVETAVRTGTPHETILDYAEEHADIIVMGTHGRTGMDRYLLGSVTENVVRMSEVPVVTIRRGEEA